MNDAAAYSPDNVNGQGRDGHEQQRVPEEEPGGLNPNKRVYVGVLDPIDWPEPTPGGFLGEHTPISILNVLGDAQRFPIVKQSKLGGKYPRNHDQRCQPHRPVDPRQILESIAVHLPE